MRSSPPSKQHERAHEGDAQLYSLQELALRLQRSTDQHEIVSESLSWASGLAIAAALMRARPPDSAFRLEATAALDSRALQALQSVAFVATEASLPGYVAANRRTVLIADMSNDQRFAELGPLARAGGFATVLGVALVVGERTLGCVLFFASAADTFDPPTIRLLELLVRQMALGIDHARAEARLHAREVQIEQRHANLRRAYDLVASERRTLAAVLDSASDAVLVTDIQGMVQLGNPAVETVLGIHPDLLIGHLLHQTDVPEPLVALAQQARAQRGDLSGELTLPDGRVFHVSIAPVRALDGPAQGYVTLLKDITYFKRLDEMKSHFVATVSHDLRSPLNMISGYAELMELAGSLNPEQADYLTKIQHATRRMCGLVANLLDLGRIEAGVGFVMRPCDMGAILVAAVDGYRMAAGEKQIELMLQLPPDLPVVQGDETRLRQVVDNLVSNALSYTPPGGVVRVWSEVVDDALTVRVQDSGIGIAPADLPQVFEPFFRSGSAKAINGEGTGLGLAIVKRLVEEHGGSVDVESAVGAGSLFCFTLPVARIAIDDE
jgi:PAS domain S-box-containing protein